MSRGSLIDHVFVYVVGRSPDIPLAVTNAVVRDDRPPGRINHRISGRVGGELWCAAYGELAFDFGLLSGSLLGLVLRLRSLRVDSCGARLVNLRVLEPK